MSVVTLVGRHFVGLRVCPLSISQLGSTAAGTATVSAEIHAWHEDVASIAHSGKKAGWISFDRVEAELIDPALSAFEITGRTTGEILEAGNIRTDMFQQLLVADIVILTSGEQH